MKAAFSLVIFLIVINGFSTLVRSQNTDSCNANLNLGGVSFETTSLNCVPAWTSHGYVLRYVRAAPGLWSFVLSAPASNAYVAIGFSTNGRMVPSSAVVGWLNGSGAGTIKQYFLGGQAANLVNPDQGSLNLVNDSMTVVSQSNRIYLAFQLRANQPLSRILYSIGPSGFTPGPDYRLVQHRDMVSTTLNFATGQNSVESRPYTRLRRSHGIINMLGWGILMLIGAIAARYFKHQDPAWFYAHLTIQACGFTLGVVGIILGFVLYDRLHADVNAHRALGITILVLGCLQAMAVLARPEKGSKVRKYWNWYHHSLGRILMILAIANVFYGIHLGGEGTGWNAGYGVALGVLLVTAAVLEIRLWKRE